MTERVNHERVFKFLCTCERRRVQTSDSLVYVFGCYVFYLVGGNGDSLEGEEFCGKNMLIIYLFCRIEKRLPVNLRMNDMNKL